MIINKNR